MERAKPHDAKEITALTMRSKEHWNYGKDQIEAWREDLTISSAYIEENQVYTLVENEKLIGFYAYDSLNEFEVQLNFLFVDPIYIGKGYGKKIMQDFLHRMVKSTYKKVKLDADPNAIAFYKRLGFTVTGRKESSLKGRYLPIMELGLDKID